MTECEFCKGQVAAPALILIKFGGGQEFRAFACGVCAGIIEHKILRFKNETND